MKKSKSSTATPERRQRERRRLCLPGEKEWEVWQQGSDGRWHFREGDRAAKASELSDITDYAFPVATVTVSPFWAVSEDPDLIPGLVAMRLESLGLKPEPPVGKHWDYRKLEEDGQRTLVLATVLEDGRPLDLPKGGAEIFDLSAQLYAMPRNHIVLWRELGRWVAAVTRNGRLIYSQGLTAGRLDADAAMELRCLMLQLRGQGVADHFSGLVVWGDLDEASRQDLKTLESELGIEVGQESRPEPLMPEAPLALLPRAVAEEDALALRRKRIRSLVMLGAGLYLLAVGAVVLMLFLEKKKTENLKTEIASLDTEWILQTQNRWNSLQPAIDGDRYPVEMLHRCVMPLAKVKGVRLLLVTIDLRRIFIRGEAMSSTAARTYQNMMVGEENLNTYEWTPQSINVDPETKVATFEIEGKYLYAAAESQ